MADNSSTCSSSKNESVQDIIKNDKVRYIRKGLILDLIFFIDFL